MILLCGEGVLGPGPLSLGTKTADISTLGVAAAEAVAQAILRAVKLAKTLAGIPGLG